MTDGYWDRYWQRRASRRRVLIGGTAVVAGSAAILAGCGDDDDDDDADTGGDATSTATGAGTATSTASGGQPVRGGTLNWWKPGADQGNDPAVFHTNNSEVTNRVFNHFLSYQVSKDLLARDGVVSYEQVDPVTLVWKLRPGMQFQGGEPVTAEDVAYSVMRVGQVWKERGSTHAPTAIFRDILSANAVDAETVQEMSSKGNASGLIYKARHYWGFVNQKITEAAGGEILELPPGVSAGPYELTTRDAQGTVITRFDGYYEHAEPDDGFVQDGPYIDEIRTRIIPDRASAKGLFASGDLDIFGAIDKLELAEFEGNSSVEIRELETHPWLPLSYDGAQFVDLRARQAIQKAIDYDAFIDTIRVGDAKFRGPVGTATPFWQRLSQEELVSYRQHDPDDAKALWEAAGAPLDRIRILAQTGDPLTADIGEFCAQNIRDALDVEVIVELNDLTTWVNKATDRSAETKPWELLLTGNGRAGGSDGAPENSHLSWYDPSGYGFNSFNIHHESPHPEILEGAAIVQDYMDKQQVEFDREARAEIITELQKWLLDNSWGHVTLPVSKTAYFGVSTRVRDAGFDDWFNDNVYIMRRHAMWLAEG